MRKSWLAVAMAVVTALLVGCGGSEEGASSGADAGQAGSSEITPPARIRSADELVVCADPTVPPVEYQQGGRIVGSDPDMTHALARRMGVKATFKVVGFDGIIAALNAHRCDAIITGMTDTPERRLQVAFVDYANVGAALMVKAGNPLDIHGLSDLSGKSVSVVVDSNNDRELNAVNEHLKAAGKPPIEISRFVKSTDAASALRKGNVDAYAEDFTSIAFYVRSNPGQFAVGGDQFLRKPYGIAVRKDDTELATAFQHGVEALYADGTMRRIFAKYALTPILLGR